MKLRKKIDIFARDHVIEILRAIHRGYNEAGRCCSPEKELRKKFSFLSYDNYRRVIGVLIAEKIIYGEGSIVKRIYKIDYEKLNINILEDNL
jgi:hypothetical protein